MIFDQCSRYFYIIEKCKKNGGKNLALSVIVTLHDKHGFTPQVSNYTKL